MFESQKNMFRDLVKIVSLNRNLSAEEKEQIKADMIRDRHSNFYKSFAFVAVLISIYFAVEYIGKVGSWEHEWYPIIWKLFCGLFLLLGIYAILMNLRLLIKYR